jgi:hypothetical protein
MLTSPSYIYLAKLWQTSRLRSQSILSSSYSIVKQNSILRISSSWLLGPDSHYHGIILCVKSRVHVCTWWIIRSHHLLVLYGELSCLIHRSSSSPSLILIYSCLFRHSFVCVCTCVSLHILTLIRFILDSSISFNRERFNRDEFIVLSPWIFWGCILREKR